MRRFLVLTFLLFAATLGARTAHACSCTGPVPIEEALSHAEVAFVGEVIGRATWDHYEVRVDGVLKGDVGDVVRIEVQRGPGSSCGTSLELGPILYTGPRKLAISQCSWRWTGAEVASVLAAERITPTPVAHAAPRPTSTGRSAAVPADDGGGGGNALWAGLGAGLLAAGAGAAVVVLRRRRNGAASAAGTASAG